MNLKRGDTTKATKLLIVRHGETVWNKSGRKQGHCDSPLTATGIRQSEAIALRLSEEIFTHLYSSDLDRAHQTAKLIAARTGHEILLDFNLRERNFGIFQGLTDDQIREQHPLEYDCYQASAVDYVIPEGESLRQLYARSIVCLQNLSTRHAGQSIAVVTHGGVIDSWFRFVFDIPLDAPRKAKLWNAGLNCIAREADGEWRLHTWGDQSHIRFTHALDDT
ncbi:MAG: histidine phosphatase family protein [Pyrinomonadaceae bacterium]|nr:histidine phosphatase family protein [Pyrinomonadaceae bacterium]